MLTITAHGADAIDDAMVVMNQAFDPSFGEAWTASQCTGVLSMPGATMLLARDDAVRGFALLRIVADEAELMLLAVSPDARGQGIGRKLLRESIKFAQQRGATVYFLEVRQDNPAIKLYHVEGLVPVGERRDYYRGNDGQRRNALTLRRTLD